MTARYEIFTTKSFDKWARRLKDPVARRQVRLRLARVRLGNFGDVVRVAGGVSEMRIHVGKGYRLYYIVRGMEVVLLVCGGDKSSQQRDIKKARAMVQQLAYE